MDDGKVWTWGRGTESAQRHADPADPTLPTPPPSTPVEAAILRKLVQRLPHYGSPELQPIQFAEAYARLVAVSVARAEFYGQLLAAEFEQREHGNFDNDQDYEPGGNGAIRALVGDTYDLDKHGDAVATGEAIRALVKLEADERDRAARLIKDGLRIGIEAKQVDVMRSYGQTVVAALRAICVEFGMSWEEETTRRAAQRAILAARTGLGQQITAPVRDDSRT